MKPDLNFVIREIDKSEIPHLEGFLYEAIFIPEGEKKPDIEIIKLPELWVYIKDFGKETDICLVADLNEELTGAIWTRIFAESEKGFGFVDPKTPELSMSVKSNLRNRGIGTRLLRAMIDKLTQLDYEQVSLSVDKLNYAFNMYRKHGFNIVDSSEKSVTMVKQLKITPKIKNSNPRMPVLFLGHGSPMNAIEENEFVDGFRETGKSIPKPDVILCISAHWETRGTFVTAMEQPETIHDFGGFPKALYEVQYPAPGSPELANRIKSLIKTTDIEPDYNWGLDHGAWSVIKHLYPKADVPVIQMSLDHYRPPQYHYDLIKELSPLRNERVLIIGSGNMVHNLRLVAWDKFDSDNFAFDWALEASEKMKNFILNNDHQSLINYRSHGNAFELAIPTPEHYLPLLYVLALKEENEDVILFNDKAVAGSLTMTSVKIG